ncbi:MAG TPA: hypothetical protein VN903_16565 [Polyangia bacterium]|nr:hypothetical protein [Polyangia bacterium]
MSDSPDRLPPELEAFLAPERRRPDPPAATQEEVFARVGASLGWVGGPGGPGTGPGGSDPSGGAATGGHAGAAGAVAAHGVKHLAAASLMKTVATLVVGGVIGGGVHEAYDRAIDRRAEHAKVAVVAPVPAPVAVPAVAATPIPVAPAAETAPAPAVVKDVHASNPVPRVEHAARTETRERDRNLAAERALIEQARTALAREQGAAALAVLERHARDFPQGALEEERESLQVQALVGVERFDQARKAAARFHRRFPRSIFGAVVDEALKSIP